MSYPIEILTTSEDLYIYVKKAIKLLNDSQDEFHFQIPSSVYRTSLFLEERQEYHSKEVFRWLSDYRIRARGHRPFIIAVLDGKLSSNRLANLFGTSRSAEGLAAFTVCDFDQFLNDRIRFIRYYLIRYCVGFLNPDIRNHDDPLRKQCIFHKKMRKIEILDSLNSGEICPNCYEKLRPKLNQDLDKALKILLDLVSNQYPYSLIMKGGGVKGIAFAGALLELEKFFSFSSFVGTSAGAIAAVLLGTGYKPIELLGFLQNKNFRDFIDTSCLKGIWNWIRKGGAVPGDEIERWLDSLIAKKIPQKLNNIQLQDLENHTMVFASRVGSGRIIFDSINERKEAIASFAVRCSMSVPYFFIPKRLDGIRVFDGGIRENFPLKAFSEKYPKKPIIGLYLTSHSKPSWFVIKDIANIALDGEEKAIVEANLDRVVIIDTEPIGTLEFNLSPDKKEYLLTCGRLAALKFINRNYPDFTPDFELLQNLEEKYVSLKKGLSNPWIMKIVNYLSLCFRRKR